MFKVRVLQSQLARNLIKGSYGPFSLSSKSIFQISAAGSIQKRHASAQSHVVTLIPGDGIGPEMMQHIQTVTKYAVKNILLNTLVSLLYNLNSQY